MVISVRYIIYHRKIKFKHSKGESAKNFVKFINTDC